MTPVQPSLPQVGLVNPVLATPLAMATILASGAKRKDEEEDGQQEALQDGALEALSEEDLSISGSSARRMVMRKLLRKQEVRVIMVTEQDRNDCGALCTVTELNWMEDLPRGCEVNVNQTVFRLCVSPSVHCDGAEEHGGPRRH